MYYNQVILSMCYVQDVGMGMLGSYMGVYCCLQSVNLTKLQNCVHMTGVCLLSV